MFGEPAAEAAAMMKVLSVLVGVSQCAWVGLSVWAFQHADSTAPVHSAYTLSLAAAAVSLASTVCAGAYYGWQIYSKGFMLILAAVLMLTFALQGGSLALLLFCWHYWGVGSRMLRAISATNALVLVLEWLIGVYGHYLSFKKSDVYERVPNPQTRNRRNNPNEPSIYVIQSGY